MIKSSYNLKDTLFEMQDPAYRDFHARLMPTIDKERIIGIRIPVLRKFAKEFSRSGIAESFLCSLPHYYYEENNLHAFMLEQIKDYDLLIEKLDIFLPYIDNWATCDMLSPKAFVKNKDKLKKKAHEWVNANDVYTVRFGIGIYMKYFFDEDFDPAQHLIISEIKSEEYYINMMIAWYFATALAKQYESTINILEDNLLSAWVHNKTIQKAIESNRIPKEIKDKLRQMKR